MKPVVSVIIPIYNSALYLNDCILSIYSQTYDDWELILVDDGSTDHSSEIAGEWAAKDQRIKYFRKENGGVSSARNYGLKVASGEYIVFVDSDDICAESMLKSLIENLDDSTDFVVGTYTSMSNFNHVHYIDTCFSPTLSILYNELIKRGLLHVPFVKLYNSGIISAHNLTFRENLQLGEDLCFNLSYLEYVKAGIIITVPIYYYRDTANSLSKNILCDYADIQIMLFDLQYNFTIRHNIDFNYRPMANVMVRDIFLSLCRCNGSQEKKTDSIRRIKKHDLMKLCNWTSSWSDFILLSMIKYLPSTILVKIIK